MAVPKWFDSNVYMSNKLAQMPSGTTMDFLVKAMNDAGFFGEEGYYQHFLAYGHAEDVAPSSGFNAQQYYTFKAADYYEKSASEVTDAEVATMKNAIKAAGMDAWTHYQKFGTVEGINASNSFDTEAYVEAKAAKMGGEWTAASVAKAIQDAGMNAYQHYMLYKGAGDDEVGLNDDFMVDPDEQTGDDDTTTFVLTRGNDKATANVFEAPLVTGEGAAALPTLNAGDNLTGVGPNPTLNAVLNGQAALRPILNGIETVNLTTTAASTLFADNAPDITHIRHIADNGNFALTVRNLAQNAAVTIDNALAGATHTDIRFVDTVVSGTEDVATLVLNNNGNAQNDSGVVNLRGETAGGFETIKLTVNGLNHIDDLGSDPTAAAGGAIGANSALRTLIIDGEGSLHIDDNNELHNVTTVDATANAGGIRVALDPNAVVDVRGGKGNDRFNFANGLTDADKVNGGEGTDTLSASYANLIAFTTQNDNIASIETLHVSTATTANTLRADLIGDAVNRVDFTTTASAANHTVRFDAGTNTIGILVNQTGNITVEANGTATDDKLILNIDPGVANPNDRTVGNLDLNSNARLIEQLDINSNNAAAAGNHTIGTITLPNTAGVTNAVTITGNASLKVGAVTADSLDASGLTNNAWINMQAASTRAIAITGSSGNDVLRGSAGNDTIVSGAGDDTIIGGGGVDAIALSGGNNDVQFGGYTASAALTTNNFTNITGFVVGATAATSDQISLSVAAQYGAAATHKLTNFDGTTAVNAADALSMVKFTTGQALTAVAANNFLKIESGVAVAANETAQQVFNKAMGGGKVTLGANGAGKSFAGSFYDTTNSRAVIFTVDSAAGVNTDIESGDTVTVVGMIDMSTADYANFGVDQFAFIA